MSIIRLLDENTINQIAAGEVVERPRAVVKELIENSIDAKSTAITVEIKEGGLSFIRITDNGMGIAKDDIPLAFMRHATSKIKSAEDLFDIKSLGFRGEALSSIAAVSQVELITKEPYSLNGYRYIIEGGEEKSLEEIGCPDGTTIIVRNLFFNTPARRKFLKSAKTETGYINDLMEKLILSHPGISFRFIANNKVILQSSGNNNIKDILYHIYGRDITREILPVDITINNVKINGFIGKPSISRGNRNYMNYFINGRFIRNNIISKAIEDAYKPYMMQHKYPFTVLYYDINPSMLDVNVHPQKLELKLKNSDDVYEVTYKIIKETLSKKELIPKISLTGNEKMPEYKKLPEPFEKNRLTQLMALETLADHTNDKNDFSGNQNKAVPPFTGYNNDITNRVPTDKNFSKHDFARNLSVHDEANHDDEAKNIVGHVTTHNMAAHTIANHDLPGHGNVSNEITAPVHNGRAYGTTFHDSAGNDIVTHNIAVHDSGAFDTIIPDIDENEMSAYDLTVNEMTANNISTHGSTAHEMTYMNSSDNLVKDSSNYSILNRDQANKDKTENEANFKSDVLDVLSDKLKSTVTSDSTDIPDLSNISSANQMDLFVDTDLQSAPFLSDKALAEHRIIGQVFSTYWLVEYKNELYIIDQHAAHEKVLYERILAAARENRHTSQMLMPPIVLTLSLTEQETISAHEQVLNQLGYEIEHFGGNEYSLRAVPADLYNLSDKDLFLEFVDELTQEILTRPPRPESILEKTASLACKSAVKANHRFSFEEASSLIKELLSLENPYNCPHGRPVIISMSKYELERKFKRII